MEKNETTLLENITEDIPTESKEKTNKKKKLRYFEVFILKILKQVSDTHGITLNAKQQLNGALCIIAKKISDKSHELALIAEKKTISIQEVQNAFTLISSGSLRERAIITGKKAIEKFENTNMEGSHVSRQCKAGIIFPPSLLERFLRVMPTIMVTKTTPIFLAAILEYILIEILTRAARTTLSHKRLTIRDIELSIRTDTELDNLFTRCRLHFLGGGVVPEIERALLAKKPKRKRKQVLLPEKRSHRFRPGTVSLREIKKCQKNSERLILPRTFFEKIVRDTLKELGWTTGMISKDSFTVLQYYMEGYIVDFLNTANKVAIHSKRIKVLTSDLALVGSLIFETDLNAEISDKNV